MNSVLKLWMFYNWVEDQNDDVELVKNHAYLLGSFWNPEAVQKLMGEGNVHVTSEEEFEASTRIIEMEKQKEKEEKEKGLNKKRRRRKIKNQ